MSTIERALQVGTLVAVSVSILACAPQQNANLLPADSKEKTQLAKISVPLETVTFSNPNLDLHVQSKPILVAQRTLTTSEPKLSQSKPIEAKDDQSVVNLAKTAKVNLDTPVAEQQTAPQLQQHSAYIFYGNPDQPGYQIQTAIFKLFDQGIALQEAAQRVVDSVIHQNQVIRDALAMAAVSQQPNLSVEFVLDIAHLTTLIDASKQAMEDNPGQISSIISLGVTLYPDFTRDIITAATLTGEMTEDEAILLAIAAGADPTSLASRTAAGSDGPGLSAFAAAPLGSGVGAGGTGGGDTTASTN